MPMSFPTNANMERCNDDLADGFGSHFSYSNGAGRGDTADPCGFVVSRANNIHAPTPTHAHTHTHTHTHTQEGSKREREREREREWVAERETWLSPNLVVWLGQGMKRETCED